MLAEQQGPTPGPWRAEIGPGEWYVAGAVRNGRPNGELIMRSVRPPRGIPDAEQEANARLVAAAHPLLAAAQGLIALIEIADSGQSVLPYDKEQGIWDAAISRLKDAVSSALGEEGAK